MKKKKKSLNRINGKKIYRILISESSNTYKFRNAPHIIKLYVRLFVLLIHTGNFQMCICQIFSAAS